MAGHSDYQRSGNVACAALRGTWCESPSAPLHMLFLLLTGGWACLWKVEGGREGRQTDHSGSIHPRAREAGRSGCPRLLGSEEPKGLKVEGGVVGRRKEWEIPEKVMSVRLPA